MRFGGFSLDIIVNGEPLPEVTEEARNKKMTTGPSYIRKGIFAAEEQSTSTYYAAVREFGARYAIRFSAPPSCCTYDNPIKVFLYVDGEYDYSYTDINPTKLSETRTCFWSKTRDKIYYFKFDPTIWSEEEDSNLSINSTLKPPPFGGPGAISVYFYCAERVPWNVAPPPDYNVKPTVVPENNDTRAIKLSTQYDVQSVPNPTIAKFDTYLQEKGSPMAVLHLHYRAVGWLRARGHNIPDPRPVNRMPMIFNDRNFTSTSQSIGSVRNTEQTDIKVKQECILIKEEPIDQQPVFITSTRRSRSEQAREIIVISSDDDDDAEVQNRF